MRIFTYGIDEKYLGTIKWKFGVGEYVNVTKQYQDILALPADIVIVTTDSIPKSELAVIKQYQEEAGDEEEREYYFLSDKELNLLREEFIKQVIQ